MGRMHSDIGSSMLALVECNHFWLEAAVRDGRIVAVCNRNGCAKRAEFSLEQWMYLLERGWATNKPVRI